MKKNISKWERTLATVTTYESRDTIINRGLSINIRDINFRLNYLFQRYQAALNIITGNTVFGNSQTRQIRDSNGVSVEYDKGRTVVKNGINRLMFLLKNRERVSSIIGIPSKTIYSNRRNLTEVDKYLNRLGLIYDLGNVSDNMQLYVSRNDANTGSLDSQQDWIDYIMTREWIVKLGNRSISRIVLSDQESARADHRIEYLSNMIQDMMADHEVDFHTDQEEIKWDDYLDRTRYVEYGENQPDMREPLGLHEKYMDAVKRLNSFGKLNYGFYEMFKPIGGTDEKYLKVKLSTSGELDISGVVGLSDCEHVEWEYGSMEYLRSLNTGNQRYDFRISIPFNDLNSVLWWKPDEKEELEPEENEDENAALPSEDDVKYRYYKPYETERFLRWFGTNFVPVMDPDTVTRKTICSSPNLSNDVESSSFHRDATHIMSMGVDMTRASMDSSTSTSLLSLVPKSTLDLVQREDGQYISMVVSGHRQTSNIAFHLTGKMYNMIQSMNHFGHTWDVLTTTYTDLFKTNLFLDVSAIIHPQIEIIWDILYPEEKWNSGEWKWLEGCLYRLQRPTTMDLLRFRQIDMDSVLQTWNEWKKRRMDFLCNISNSGTVRDTYLGDFDLSSAEMDKVLSRLPQSGVYEQNLFDYIYDFNYEKYTDNYKEFRTRMFNVPMMEGEFTSLVQEPLSRLFGCGLSEEARAEELSNYKISFDDVRVDDIRESIQTFNNLIVRLPMDTYHNKVASRNIFRDWKCYVDGALDALVGKGELFKREDRTGMGTDGSIHTYTEYYTDSAMENPLVDYSYLYDENGELIVDDRGYPKQDRWDYWTEDDFR